MTNITDPITRNTVLNAIEKQEKSRIDAKKKQDEINAANKYNIPPEMLNLPSGLQKAQYENDSLNSFMNGGNFGRYNSDPSQNNQAQNNFNGQENRSQQNGFDLSQATESQLNKMLTTPRTRPMAQSEITRRENEKKNNVLREQQALKDTQKLRQDIAEKGNHASKSIANKEQQKRLIKKGNLDSPELTYIASKLPSAIGNKLLSDDTLVYRSGLLEDFSVMRDVFKGPTRIKEIELTEDKLATLDKSDKAKSRILDRGIDNLKVDQIRARAAARVEKQYPYLPNLQFNQKVDEEAKSEMDILYNEMMTEYENIFFDEAPDGLNFYDETGRIYENVARKDLRKLYDQAKKDGREINILKDNEKHLINEKRT